MKSLDRFAEAQKQHFGDALDEIRAGKKRTHWMWFIFPQLRGLGQSETSRFYGIDGLREATGYLNDERLRENLVCISAALLALDKPAYAIFGSPDDMKLRSSMTLFSKVPGADPVFRKVLDKFFDGAPDPATLQLLGMAG